MSDGGGLLSELAGWVRAQDGGGLLSELAGWVRAQAVLNTVALLDHQQKGTALRGSARASNSFLVCLFVCLFVG